MHQAHDLNGISNETLSCLNGWPEGTIAHRDEELLIATLNRLCKDFGYGRVPQLAKAIEEIWRDPQAVERHEERRQKHLQMMAEANALLAEEG